MDPGPVYFLFILFLDLFLRAYYTFVINLYIHTTTINPFIVILKNVTQSKQKNGGQKRKEANFLWLDFLLRRNWQESNNAFFVVMFVVVVFVVVFFVMVVFFIVVFAIVVFVKVVIIMVFLPLPPIVVKVYRNKKKIGL